MPSRSVQPAGKRYLCGGYVGGADAPARPVACQGCAGQRQFASRWRCRLPRRLKRLIRWGLPSVHASGRGTKSAGRQRVRRMLTCPASWGEDGRKTGPDAPTQRELPSGTVTPVWGCVRPGRLTSGYRNWLPGDAGEKRSRSRVSGSGVPVQKAASALPATPPRYSAPCTTSTLTRGKTSGTSMIARPPSTPSPS
jgi:hypothetical protein